VIVTGEKSIWNTAGPLELVSTLGVDIGIKSKSQVRAPPLFIASGSGILGYRRCARHTSIHVDP
jgi:hypothetical protein